MAKTNAMTLPTHQSLPANVRTRMSSTLNGLLASAVDLYSHAKQAHWNVRGHEFIAIHELFDKVAAEAEAHADELAERTGQLGGGVQGTVRMAAKNSELTEYPLSGPASCAEHIEQVSKSLGLFSKLVREAIGEADKADDPVTADILTGICRATDKTLWFVESHGVSARR